jgi:hypothetical protein
MSLVSEEPARTSQSQLYSASQQDPLELLITTIFAILTAVSQYRVTPHGPHITRPAQQIQGALVGFTSCKSLISIAR